jgi:hypothetical protein
MMGSPNNSPLGHKPLVPKTMLNVFLVATALSCASGSVPEEQALDLGSSGLQALSGEWSGTLKTRQAGKCSIGFRLDQRWQSSALREKVRIRVAVDPDGAFTGREHGPDGTEFEWVDWRGTLSDALHVVAIRGSQAECRGEKSEIKTQLEGRVVRGRDGPTLELSGREEWCPKMGCIFAVTYRLVKR